MIDWRAIDTVLLDMDGTLLDLHFDNYFWGWHLPARYAEIHGADPADSRRALRERFDRERGSLNWYSLDYWSRQLGVDVPAIKREIRHRVRVRPHVEEFLRGLRGGSAVAAGAEGAAARIGGTRELAGRGGTGGAGGAAGMAVAGEGETGGAGAARAAGAMDVVLVTNAHRESLRLKLAQTGLARWFDRIVVSHDLQAPKEAPDFWPRLHRLHPFDPAKTLLIDDSEPVLEAAQGYGIRHLLTLLQPDSTLGKRPDTRFPGIHHFDEIMPG